MSVSLIDGHIDPDTSRMTDKEIIRSLECCISPECDNCPYDGDDLLRPCNHNLMKDALDLINRLQAENSNLTSNLTSLQNDLTSAKAEIKRLTTLAKLGNMRADDYRAMRDKCKTARAEAINDFSGKIADVFCSHDKGDTYVREVVYNLVKEMVGKDK